MKRIIIFSFSTDITDVRVVIILIFVAGLLTHFSHYISIVLSLSLVKGREVHELSSLNYTIAPA